MLKRLTRLGIQRGLLGDSQAWSRVLLVVGAVRLVGRLVRSKPEVVCSATLEPGDSVVITHAAAGKIKG